MFVSSLTFGLALLPFTLGAVHEITVGGEGNLVYSPEAIFAAPGDQVVFTFATGNHTVTESSFNDPCGRKDGGHQSGFQFVAPNSTTLPTYTIDVTNTDPIWIYCAQAARTPNSHCGRGMVFAINCGPDGAPNSFLNFKNSALEVGKRLQAEGAATGASTTAAYGTLTIPAAPSPTLVTQTITLQASTWTTTYSSYPGSPEATPVTLEGQVHQVIVGGPGQLVFDPPFVSARPRDVISFQFRQKNHTVTQSSFDDPCRPLTVEGVIGFDSGFQAVADGSTEFPIWNFTVTDTAPVWAYCRQRTPASHCGAGMVFAINPAEEGRTFDAFQNVAKTLNGTAVSSTTNDTNSDDTAGDDDGSSSAVYGNKWAFTAALGLIVAAWL